MLFRLAWKNIWRKPQHSLVLISAVFMGIFLGLFVSAFVNGLAKQRLSNQLNNTLAPIKITHKKFSREKPIAYPIANLESIVKSLKHSSSVRAFSPRINFYGNIRSKKANFQVDIYGVNPLQEKEVFGLYSFLSKGKYLDASSRRCVFLGEKLATRLDVRLGSSLELSFRNLKGKLVSSRFEVIGIYKIANTAFERSHVFVRKRDLEKVLNQKEEIAHQIAIKIDKPQEAFKVSKSLGRNFKNTRVQTWQEVAPDLAYIEVMMQGFFWLLMGVIMIGLAMLIVNIMLMSVLERQVEFEVLWAIGMSQGKVFWLIMFETLFTNLIALPLGLFLAYLSIFFSSRYGINLSQFSDGLSSLGYDSNVYPVLAFWEYFKTSLFLVLVAFLSAIYPATKAVRY